MASESDDIDAGWDDEPMALAGETSVPPLPLEARAATPLASSESLSPTEVEASPPSATTRGLPRIGAPLAVVAALAAGTLLWFQRAAPPSAPAAAARPEARELETPVTQPVAPAPAPERPISAALTPPASPSADPSATTIDEASIAPLVLYAPESVKVEIRSVPEGASFFESRKRLGTGVVSVSVGHKSKRWLTALLDGYEPLNFTLDTSREAVTVTLTPKR